MNLWPCFICKLETLCEHRELELMIWVRQVESDQREAERRRSLEGLRMPVASETGRKPAVASRAADGTSR